MALFDVLAIGELNADMIFTGLKQGPALNQEITADRYSRTLGSSTALCAVNTAKLGLRTAFCGKVGKDELGGYVLGELEKQGIDTRFCLADPQEETGLTLALNWDGDRALVTFLGAIQTFSIRDFDAAIIRNARHIHVGSFFLQAGLRKDIAGVFKKARQWGITTSLDTGWDSSGNWDYGIGPALQYTDLFFPNETEALHITGASSYEEAAAALGKWCKTVVIKRGRAGAYCVSQGQRYAAAAIGDMPVADTTGAGDSFNAGFIFAFIAGLSPGECLEYGNACGALCVGALGGANAPLNPEKVRELIRTSLEARALPVNDP
jgi:sugar/nucleoside kinase (ribokinase family)